MTRVVAGLAFVTLVLSPCRPPAQRLAERADAMGSSQGAASSAGDSARVVTRRAWAQAEDLSGSPSPDGRYLSFTDWKSGDLAVHDLVTGQNRRVTDKGTWESSANEFAYASVFAPDGRRIAYSWQNKEGVCELRVISVAGGAPKVLFSRKDDVMLVQPTGWSPDGLHIVAALWRRDRSRQIALISVETGAVRVLKSFDWREPRRMTFSPDGRYIAYDFPPGEESPARDIYVLAADATRETRVRPDPANEVLFGWSLGGQELLFASDRTGAPGVWRVRIAEGKPVASPELVRPELWGLEPMGTARNGYFYAVAVEVPRVYTASLDMATGQVLSAPRAVTQTPQAESSSPDWSPDGQRLAYIVRPLRGGRPLVAVQSVGSADVRELNLEFEDVHRARWAPDGRSLLLTGHHKGRYGLHRVDLETGSTNHVDPAGFYSALSPDGKAIYRIKYNYDAHNTGLIMARDLPDGDERELHSGARLNGLSVSPDGTLLAFSEWDSTSQSASLRVMPVQGGEPRTVHRLSPGNSFQWRTQYPWTPDGLGILFVKGHDPGSQGDFELWRVGVRDGEARKLLSMPGMLSVRIHPDGRRIAFSAGESKAELWVLEHFLPTPGGATGFRPPNR